MSFGGLAALPRARLATLPTPLEEAPGLSAALGGPRILVKREDLTGFALGGSKVRKLEMILGDALAQQADTLVVSGDLQSNLSRLVAAAAASLGLRAVLVLGGEADESRKAQGNLLLDALAGAEIRYFTGDFREGHERSLAVAEELRRAGRVPYVVPLGGSGPLGASGYLEAARELREQLAVAGVEAASLIVPVGSCGTMAGLLLGVKVLALRLRVVGMSVSRPEPYVRERVAALVSETAALLGIGVEVPADEVIVHDEWIGPGFGILGDEARDALRFAAARGGLYLDPVYNAKAFAGLRALVRRGSLGPRDTVVFVHTGGVPALFAYAEELAGAPAGGS